MIVAFESLKAMLARTKAVPGAERPVAWQDAKQEYASWKQHVLDDFAQWLGDLPDEDPSKGSDAQRQDDSSATDLLMLIGETTALKQEVKLMSRSSGKLLGAVEGVAATVTDTVVPLVEELRRYDRDSRTEGLRSALRPLILEIGDLSESARETLGQLADPTWPWYVPKRVRRHVDTANIRVLQQTLLKRIDSVLQRYDVRSIAAVNDAFDSTVMTVVGTSDSGAVEAGRVSSVVKQGFAISGEVLRPAHVIVEEEKTS